MVLQESLQGNGCLFGCLIDGHRLDTGNPKAYFSTQQIIDHDDVGVYQPNKWLSEVLKLQEQDEILRSVQALQQGNSAHIPSTLRHALFRKDYDDCSSSAEMHISSSPGRMDLMGGFADYSGSHAIQHPTGERVVSLATVDDPSQIFQCGRGKQSMIRLACIQVPKLSELSRAIAIGDFKVRETAFPTEELFMATGQLKPNAELRTTLSKRLSTDDGYDLWELYLTGIIHGTY